MAGEFTTEQLRAMMMEALGKGGGGPGPGADENATLAYYKKLNAELKDSTTKTKLFTNFLKGGTIELANFKEKISKLDDEIENMSESQAKRNLIAERDELKAAAARAQSTDANIKFAKSVGSAAAAASGKFVTSLQGGSSGFAIATDLMSVAIDATSGAAQMAGNAIGAAGAAASGAKGALGGLAKAASVLGPLFGATAAGAGKIAKFGFEVLQKEVEKSVAAYNSAATSGALFAGGMTELRNSASRAGLDVAQFANVLREHSSDIASIGMGIAEGAKRIGGVVGTFAKDGGTMKRQLVNMGFSFEEQAGLVAETMSTMKGSSLQPLNSTNDEIATQTMKYAENLRIISAITGEDAKKKSESVRQQMTQLAFQQKLAAKSPEERIKIENAMKNMDEITRKNFMDMVNFGSVINREGAMMQSVSGGLANEVNQTYRSFMDGTMDDTTQRKIAAENNEQRRKDTLAATAIGAAGAANVGGPAQVLAEGLGKMLIGLNKNTPEAIAAAEAAVKEAKNTTDKFSDVAIAAQDFRLILQDQLTPVIKQFASVSLAMLGEVKSMLASLGIVKKDDEVTGEKKGTNWKRVALESVGGVGGVIAGTALGAGVASPMAAAGLGLAGYGLGGQLADILGIDPHGKANGGISSGPASGFLEKLHGTEAVVPLPDGKTIPVAITSPLDSVSTSVSSASDTSSNMMRDLLSRQLDLMQKTFDQTTEMLSSFNDSKQLQQQLVHNSY